MLAARQLTKRYGARTVVDKLDLAVEPGDVYGFLGPNGAGKTTTLRMLLGLVHPSAGDVTLFGQHLTPRHRAPLARVGAIVEAPAFYLELTARKNLELLASLTGPCPPRRIDQVLDRVGLTDRQHDRVRIYSHGMKQRLAIAAALLPRPELVILDEPTNGLDPIGIRELRALIRSLAVDDGLTVVLSSHLLAEVEQVCKRAVVIARGRAVWEGEVAGLLAGRRKLRLLARPTTAIGPVVAAAGGMLGLDGEVAWITGVADVPALVAALVTAGVAVAEVTPWTPTLEEVFLDLVAAPQPMAVAS